MDRLRTDQHELLARHRERVVDAMLVASAGRRGRVPLGTTAEGRRLLAEPPDRLASVAVSAAAASVERRRIQEDNAARAGRAVRLRSADLFPGQVLSALVRRRLPFTGADVELLLDLGGAAIRPAHPSGPSLAAMSFAVSAARHLLDTEPGSPVVLAALGRARTAVGAVDARDPVGVADVARRILVLLAESVPGGLLDLSLVDRRDAWGRPAARALRRHGHEWDGAQQLVALLGRATGPRPTATWRRRSAALAAAYPAYGELLREMLEPLLTIELVDSGAPRPRVWLLAPRNEVLAKGAVWASVDADEPWTAPLLGRLALRCAAPSPHAVARPLSHAVARAAIEALDGLGTEPAHAELRLLLGELRRADLLRRVSAVVGESPEQARARGERLRRERRAARPPGDPSRSRRRAAAAFVQRDLAPALGAAGFDDAAGRMFWRSLGDRVELLHCRVHREGVTLELGIWFRFIPRAHPVPRHDSRPRPVEAHCDLRGTVHAPFDDLGSSARLSALWFARWRSLEAVLRRLQTGPPSHETFGWGSAGSPRQAVLAGYVARELGDRRTARVQLRRAAGRYRAHVDGLRPARTADAACAWDAWVETLERDAQTT